MPACLPASSMARPFDMETFLLPRFALPNPIHFTCVAELDWIMTGGLGTR